MLKSHQKVTSVYATIKEVASTSGRCYTTKGIMQKSFVVVNQRHKRSKTKLEKLSKSIKKCRWRKRAVGNDIEHPIHNDIEHVKTSVYIQNTLTTKAKDMRKWSHCDKWMYILYEYIVLVSFLSYFYPRKSMSISVRDYCIGL